MKNEENSGKLLPESPIAKAFVKLFPHRWDFIESEANPVKWCTVKNYYLESRTLCQRYCDPSILLGVRFGQNTSYGLIDIDRGSPYHPYNDEHAFKNLLSALESAGLCKYIIVRSSDSEGIHIYYFFPEALNSFQVACAVKYSVMQAGYKVEGGILEIFPNTKAYVKKGFSNYNGHRLPLQIGSYILDDDYQPYSNSVETFVRLAEETAQQQDMETFKRLLPIARRWYKETKGRYTTGKIFNTAARWRADVEHLIAQGWTGYGQTNEMLKEIGKYARVFLGLAGEELWQKMVEIAQGCPGYETWCRHQREIDQRCREWAKIIESYWIPLYSDPQRQETYRQMMERGIKLVGRNINQERHEKATERIIAAVKHIIEELQEIPKQVTQWIKTLKQATKKLFNITVSETTLRRPENLSYWHPRHRDWTEGLEEITIPHDVMRGSDTGELPPSQNSQLEGQNPDVSRDEPVIVTVEPTSQKIDPSPQEHTTSIQQLELSLGENPTINPRPFVVAQPDNEKQGKIAPQKAQEKNTLQPNADGADGQFCGVLQHTPLNEGFVLPDLSGGDLSGEEQVSSDPKVQEEVGQHKLITSHPCLKSPVTGFTLGNNTNIIQPEQSLLEALTTSSEGIDSITLQALTEIQPINCLSPEVLPEIIQRRDFKKNDPQQNLTDGEVLEILRKAPKLLFTGKTFATTVYVKDIAYPPQARLLETNTEVIFMPDTFHSQHPKLLYVQPTQGDHDWLQGIPVPIESLQPIQKSNLYNFGENPD